MPSIHEPEWLAGNLILGGSRKLYGSGTLRRMYLSPARALPLYWNDYVMLASKTAWKSSVRGYDDVLQHKSCNLNPNVSCRDASHHA